MTDYNNANKIVEAAMGEAEANSTFDNNYMETICMSDIEMKPISWLWQGRIARGKQTVIAGNPGLGKSQITAFITSVVSTGKNWPDAKNQNPAGNVIILSAEDDPGDTIKPRLIAAGADLNKCHVMVSVKIQNKDGRETVRTFNLAEDIKHLEAVLERIGNVMLVIIDPISAYLGETDSHNNSDMRGVLAPLAEMAMRHNTAFILVTHFNKSTQQEAIGRVIGSIGLIAAARAGYGVIKDEHKPNIRYFVPLKNNIGNDSTGFAYNIESVVLEQGIETSKINWHPGTVDAQKILNPEKKTQVNGAKEFLQELLSGGPKAIKEILEEAEGMSYSKGSIQRAATKLGVKKVKAGMKGGWAWSLPDHEDDACTVKTSSTSSAEEPEDTTHKNMSSSTPSQPSKAKTRKNVTKRNLHVRK